MKKHHEQENMRAIKQFLVSRKTVTWLIILILLGVLLGAVLPQQVSTPAQKLAAWYDERPLLRIISHYLGLDHIYTTGWFALLVTVFSVSLAISSYEQAMLAWRKTFGTSGSAGNEIIRIDEKDEARAVAVLKQKGYYALFHDLTEKRFVKHPWGYWGNFLLHLGMLVVIAASLVVMLTTKRAKLQLYEGESYVFGSNSSAEETGLLIKQFPLKATVTLKTIRPEFWDNDGLRQITTSVDMLSRDGETSLHTITINQSIVFDAIKIYHDSRFGMAFFVEFLEGNGQRHGEIFMLPNPPRRSEAGYENFRPNWLPYMLKTKYYADAERVSLLSDNPLFVLRLEEQGSVNDELSLKKGETGRLGNYTVRLVDTKRWGTIIFSEVTGMRGIYAGFFIIILGSALTYFTPPVEVVIRGMGEKAVIMWKSGRFEGLFAEEIEGLRDAFSVPSAGTPPEEKQHG